MTGVYKITNKINNKSYIGKSEVDISYRLSQHKRGIYSNEHLQRAIQKYGIENFTFEVLEECSKDLCCDREIYWIKYYNTLYPNGYNYTTGGENKSGFSFSDISKQKMSEKAKVRCNTIKGKKAQSDKAKKRVWTEEQKKKVSETLKRRYKEGSRYSPKGTKHSEETKKKMSESRKGKREGCKWYNNGEQNKMIKPQDFDLYVSLGYKPGLLKRN